MLKIINMLLLALSVRLSDLINRANQGMRLFLVAIFRSLGFHTAEVSSIRFTCDIAPELCLNNGGPPLRMLEKFLLDYYFFFRLYLIWFFTHLVQPLHQRSTVRDS